MTLIPHVSLTQYPSGCASLMLCTVGTKTGIGLNPHYASLQLGTIRLYPPQHLLLCTALHCFALLCTALHVHRLQYTFLLRTYAMRFSPIVFSGTHTFALRSPEVHRVSTSHVRCTFTPEVNDVVGVQSKVVQKRRNERNSEMHLHLRTVCWWYFAPHYFARTPLHRRCSVYVHCPDAKQRDAHTHCTFGAKVYVQSSGVEQ